MFNFFNKKKNNTNKQTINDYVDGLFALEVARCANEYSKYFFGLDGWKNKEINMYNIFFLTGFTAYAALFENNKTQTEANIVSTEVTLNLLKDYEKQKHTPLTSEEINELKKMYGEFMNKFILAYQNYLNKKDLGMFSQLIFHSVQEGGSQISDGFLTNEINFMPLMFSLKNKLKEYV